MSNGQGWKVDSDETLLALFKHAQEVVKEGGTLVFNLVKTDKRTTQQNNALHLYFKLLADDLNESGFIDLEITLGKNLTPFMRFGNLMVLILIFYI